jgi:hypothetical protein
MHATPSSSPATPRYPKREVPRAPRAPRAHSLMGSSLMGPLSCPLMHTHTQTHKVARGTKRRSGSVWVVHRRHPHLSRLPGVYVCGWCMCMWLAYGCTPRLAALYAVTLQLCMWLWPTPCMWLWPTPCTPITYLASRIVCKRPRRLMHTYHLSGHEAPRGVCTRSLARAAAVGLELCALACVLPLSRFSLPHSLSRSQ